ncbi:MAG: MotA/TolQ/ExbB proton channel family protein [Spirochaetes bacterium]|nr:MotA/TolQ/ExbB proton channel family protein [Spirochaetota bacterium]
MQVSSIVIIIPIIVFSIFSIAIILDRMLFLRKNKINLIEYQTFFPANIYQLKKNIQNKDYKTPFENIVHRIFNTSISNRSELNELLDSSFAQVYLEYHKRINYLGIFSKLATLLGLFGTVIGMILAFNNIVEKGISTASIVAGGISTALITTAIGLSVAIPTTFFHDYFQHKIEKEIKKMEIILSEIINALIRISKSKQETT